MKKRTLNLAQTALAMAILTLISKCFGFVREMVIAGIYGTSYVVDAYVMAQNIPNVFFAGVLSAVSTSFMPLFSEKKQHDGDESANSFVNDILNLLLATSCIVAVFGILFSKQLVHIFAIGFTGEQVNLTIFFLKVSFVILIFGALNQILISFLQCKNVFLPQVTFGYLQNIIVILFVVISAFTSAKLLIFGLLVSFVLINFIATNLAKKEGLKRQYKLGDIRVANNVMLLAFPVFIGEYASQINTYFDKMLASELPEGSVAALNYALLIIGLISGLTASIISTVTFPKLNQSRVMGEKEYYSSILSKSINLMLIILIPFSLGAMFFSEEVVRFIFERGAFDYEATQMTSLAIFYYAPFLVFSSLNIIITQAFHSNKDMKTPMMIGIVTVALNVFLNIMLVKSMGIGGLAFATSISAGVGMVLRIYFLKIKLTFIKLNTSAKKLLQILVAAVCSVASGKIIYYLSTQSLIKSENLAFLIAMIVSVITYLLFLHFSNNDEIKEFKRIILKR